MTNVTQRFSFCMTIQRCSWNEGKDPIRKTNAVPLSNVRSAKRIFSMCAMRTHETISWFMICVIRSILFYPAI